MATTEEQYLELAKRLAKVKLEVLEIFEDLENFQPQDEIQLKLADEILPAMGKVIHDFYQKGGGPSIFPLGPTNV